MSVALCHGAVGVKDRLGSKAALTGPKRRFRFAPINGHQSTGCADPSRAITGHEPDARVISALIAQVAC